MNECIVTGNLGADPQVFYSQEGNPVVSFNLAFKSSKDKTNWIKVVCFRSVAEVAQEYLHKGDKVLLSATLDQRKWQAEDGQQRSAFQLIANRIEFLKTKTSGSDDSADQENNAPDGDAPF